MYDFYVRYLVPFAELLTDIERIGIKVCVGVWVCGCVGVWVCRCRTDHANSRHRHWLSVGAYS